MKKLVMAALLALTFVPAAHAICPAGPPTLTSPADNAQVNFGNVMLNWTAVAGATKYELWLGVDGDPTTFQGETTFTSKQINVEPGRTIQWKVGAKADACPTQYASYFFFTTSCPTLEPNLREPDPGERFQPGDVITFDWVATPGATSYDVRVTPDFGQTFETIAENIAATEFSTNDLPAGNWGWHVRANFDGDCDPLFSEPSSFLITNCTNETPVLVEPANNATVSQPITFKWMNAGADEYQVWVEQGNFSRPVGSTQGTALQVDDLQGGTYTWWVVAKSTGCPDAASLRRVVNVEGAAGCPTNPGKATLVSPQANATNLSSPVLFDWNPVPNASGYRVFAIFGADPEPAVLGTTDANTTQLSAKLPAGSGTWFVQTLFGDDCPTTLSERRVFAVAQGASCSSNQAPQLTAPPNGAQNFGTPVMFNWADVPDAIGYGLFVRTGNANEFSLYGTTDRNVTQLERFVPIGEISWYVVARFSGCPDVKSATFTFSSGTECVLGPVQITSPAANAEVNSPVAIAWNAVSNATQYRVTLKTENGAIALSSRTTNTSVNLRLPSGTFIVQVDALRDGCESSSAERKFIVTEAANCASNAAPVLVSPVGTEQQPAQAQSPVTLTWNAVSNALGYRVWIARNNEPFEDVALTTQTSDQIELEPGRYRWFVQGLFEGCDPTRSPIAFFVVPDNEGCTTADPQVTSPTEGQQVLSPVTFSWNGVPNAKKYRVIAVIDDKPVLIGATEDTQLERILPPGNYTFLVQAEFDDCASTESDRIHFTVLPSVQACPSEAAQLLSPANGATNVDPEVDFAWAPVSGALTYSVIAKVNDGAETVIGTTDGTSLRRRMPPGKIFWTVIAHVPGCNPLRGQPFTFTVPRLQNCSERKPVLLFPTGDDGDVPSPIEFAWIGVPGAIEYRIWVPQGSPVVVATTTEQHARVVLPPGTYRWYVEARFEGSCPSTFSAVAEFTAVDELPCATPARPEAQVIGQAVSGVPYQLRWTPLTNVSSYEVQESTSLDFENASSFTSFRPSMKFTHEVNGTPVQYFYRVRGVSACSDERGKYSDVVDMYVIDAKTNNASSELGTEETIVQELFIPGGSTTQHITITADKPWITVEPSSAMLPPEGITVKILNAPSKLGIGTNTATLNVTYSSAVHGGVATNDTSVAIPTSISLVTPVMPSGKGTPPPDALIFAAVGHAAGVNDSLFESDIRLTNLSAQTMKYDLNFTPSGVDGTQTGITSTIEVAPGATMALDDVVATAFGSGTIGSSIGMLEVRPVTTVESSGGFFGSITESAAQQIHTVASSRTYNFTPNGTFGQFIPATRFADFVGRGSVLALQQVSQSAAFRANFGFLEASGNPVDLVARVYDAGNNLLATLPISLGAMQHRQINNMLQDNGITNLADGRVEVEVLSGDGKVTAYVSEVDNATNDPLLVSAVPKGAVRALRYTVPGMAYINTGSAFWVTDLRVFNSDSTATNATLTFYPWGSPTATITREITLLPGEIEVLNNVLVNTFGINTTAGGSILITTPNESSLIATARTYNQTSNGTYGQYIPGVTVDESVGLNDRALQILQVEQSTRIRTNIGVTETSGKPVTVEISLITPDSLSTPVVQMGLQPNEFQQIGLGSFGVPDAVYNGRVTVKVISGEGTVTAYGSAIDQITQDPTYVPAQ